MTTETITRIAEFEALLPSSDTAYEYGDTPAEGFEITTTAQTVRLYIRSGQDCCENAGYFMTQDNLDDFIGAELLDIKVVDSDLKHPKLCRPADASYAPGECFIHDGDTMFVNIETSKGLLQFVAYNEHNGYYSHNAGVVSTMLKHNTRL